MKTDADTSKVKLEDNYGKFLSNKQQFKLKNCK